MKIIKSVQGPLSQLSHVGLERTLNTAVRLLNDYRRAVMISASLTRLGMCRIMVGMVQNSGGWGWGHN